MLSKFADVIEKCILCNNYVMPRQNKCAAKITKMPMTKMKLAWDLDIRKFEYISSTRDLKASRQSQFLAPMIQIVLTDL